jgi:hypothetical protein
MQKSNLVSLAAMLACFVAPVALNADEHGDARALPSITPVETRTCDFNEGKSMADLDEVLKDFNKWLDDEKFGDYFAALLVPNYFGEVAFQIGWLGAWRDGNAMGAGMDLWVNESGNLPAAFAEVVTCGSHSQFAAIEIRPAGQTLVNDDRFVLSFSNCSAKEGKTFDAVMAGMNLWAEHQAANGFGNATWMLFPIYGESDNDYDFKVVEGYDSHTASGRDFELMGNEGHWQKSSEIFDALLDCDIPRVYDAVTVREIQDAD